VQAGRLTWFTHHGKKRLRLSNTVNPPDIVFTTYQTVEREKRNSKPNHGSIFSYHWKRIILDEGMILSPLNPTRVTDTDTHSAHIIRNYKTATAQAIATLRATSRWAMSGTPIQNSLADFLGLFKFLHFAPYDDPNVFDDEISNLWRSKPVEEATETFKKLLSCVMLRRTKAILDLPSRDDQIVRLSFNYLEKEHYRRVEQPVAEMLDNRTEEESHNTSNSWLHIIQQINKLRLVCNLGTFIPDRQLDLVQRPEGNQGALSILAARLSMGGEMCGQCLQLIDSSPSGNELEVSVSHNAYYSACHRLFCADCSLLSRYQTPEPCACSNPSLSCPLRPLLPLLSTPALTPTRDSSPYQLDTDTTNQISSKVRAVVLQIKAHPKEKK
jgi:SWI/SNF-related matrix-associated actin-dependent regulator of chromatin subfamily A3